MGILIIDGNSVFEIDEECVKKNKIPRECDIEKYMQVEKEGMSGHNQSVRNIEMQKQINHKK